MNLIQEDILLGVKKFYAYIHNVSDKLNILIVDDEVLLRQGVRAMLEKEIFVNNVFEAATEEEFLECVTNNHVHFILLDIRLKSTTGFHLLRKLSSISYKPYVVGLTGLDGTEAIINLLKEGVHSVIYKLDGFAEIIRTIKNVTQRGTYFPDSIMKIIQTNAGRWDEVPPVVLTSAERSLLMAVARGETTKEIAEDLKMSPATIETYRIRLLRKVGVSNTAGLLAYAFRNGML